MNKTVESYGKLAIKKNGVTPLAAIWMDVEISILSEVSQRKTNISLVYVIRNLAQSLKSYLQNRN